MFFADDASDSSSDDLPVSSPKKALEDSFNQLTPWSQIADKFRCLIITLKPFAIVEFLDSLLTFVRKGPKDSRKFTRSIFKYLFATKNLASKEAVDESYYDHLRKVLVLYCVLELRMINCFDDDSMVASDLLLKIMLLMQGSTSITVMDVLIDIDEQIQASRSISIMKIVYRTYLTRTLVGPTVLDDTSFVKHLILFRAWYNAEPITEKVNVFKLFMSTIRPPQALRSNPSYRILDIYNADEVGDYKKLLQQPFPRNALVRALRDDESTSDSDSMNVPLLDFTINDAPAIKVEADVSLNLPNEVINVDDDDDYDIMEISYLPKLFERCDDINLCERRLAVLQTIPIATVDLVSSDSDAETTELLSSPDASGTNLHNAHDSLDHSTCTLLDGIRRSNVSLKTYARKRDTNETKSLTIKHTSQLSAKVQPILRSRSSAPLGKCKKVTFSTPLATKHVFERCDYDDEDSHSNVCVDGSSSGTDLASSYIVTGPQCNFPYVSTSVARFSSTSETEDQNESQVVNKRRSRKKKRRSLFTNVNSKSCRTSLDSWMKRKKLVITQSKRSVVEVKKCSINLLRCDDPLTGQLVRAESGRISGVHSERVGHFDEDMTLKENLEAKERLLAKTNCSKNCESQSQIRDVQPKSKTSTELNSNDSIARKTAVKKTVSAKSKTVLRSIEKKSTKRKAVLTINNGQESELRNCFVLLKRIEGVPLKPIGKNAPKKSHKRLNDETTKSTTSNDSICRLPKKSPQEYQFKRSFEKVTVIENTSTGPSLRVLSPNNTMVPSILFEKSATSNPVNQLPESIKHSQEIALPQKENTSQPSKIVPAMCVDSPAPESDPIVEDSVTTPSLGSINHEMEIVREVTSCSPDSTTPPHLPMKDANTEPTAKTESDENLEKRLQMAFDDCDIPSPVYSPYQGKRKHKDDFDERSKQKIAVRHSRLITISDSANNCDAITPIDLRLNVSNDDGSGGSEKLTISISQPILGVTADELITISSQQLEDLVDEPLRIE